MNYKKEWEEEQYTINDKTDESIGLLKSRTCDIPPDSGPLPTP